MEHQIQECEPGKNLTNLIKQGGANPYHLNRSHREVDANQTAMVYLNCQLHVASR